MLLVTTARMSTIVRFAKNFLYYLFGWVGIEADGNVTESLACTSVVCAKHFRRNGRLRVVVVVSAIPSSGPRCIFGVDSKDGEIPRRRGIAPLTVLT